MHALNPSPLTSERTTRLVEIAARRYRRRSWWVDEDDLRQEGHLALVAAARTYDPQIGAAPEAYFWRAIVLAMKRLVWNESCPVSGGTHRPRESYAGLQRASLHPCDEPPLLTSAPPADELLDAARYRVRVRRRLVELAQGDEALVAEMLDVVPPAARERCTQARRLRVQAAHDPELYALWTTTRMDPAPPRRSEGT